MSKRDREIREMIERAWEEEERKNTSRGVINFSESDMRLLEEYYAIGLPYGDSPEGFNRWLNERAQV